MDACDESRMRGNFIILLIFACDKSDNFSAFVKNYQNLNKLVKTSIPYLRMHCSLTYPVFMKFVQSLSIRFCTSFSDDRGSKFTLKKPK